MIFLKLGGSLITDKDRPHTALPVTIRRLGEEIRNALETKPGIKLILGHGSGSFGHVPAAAYHTMDGVRSNEEWLGFLDVWRQARDLNQIVVDELSNIGLPVIAFPPSSFLQTSNRIPASVLVGPLQSALAANLVPLVAGDVIFDSAQGGTILSTEEVFLALAQDIEPNRVLICGSDEGVFQDFPANRQLVSHITPAEFTRVQAALFGSKSTDVTGGMVAKVETMIRLVHARPQVRALIFSGTRPGVLFETLLGSEPGTTITANSGETV